MIPNNIQKYFLVFRACLISFIGLQFYGGEERAVPGQRGTSSLMQACTALDFVKTTEYNSTGTKK
jgi:hypothetical protein